MRFLDVFANQGPFWRRCISKRATVNVAVDHGLVARACTVVFELHLRIQVWVEYVLVVVMDFVEQILILKVENLVLEQRLVDLPVFYLLESLVVLWLVFRHLFG